MLASVGVVVVGSLAFLAGAGVASHQNGAETEALSVGAGAFDVRREGTAEFRGDFHARRVLFAFRPVGGVMATSRGSLYACGGFGYDLYLGSRFVFSPSFAPGLYSRGSGLELGSAVEFRSQVELLYRFKSRSRLGVLWSHMSNAGIGSTNPGAESLLVTFSVPLHSGKAAPRQP
jgi:lipid A 3-O-deacylase